MQLYKQSSVSDAIHQTLSEKYFALFRTPKLQNGPHNLRLR